MQKRARFVAPALLLALVVAMVTAGSGLEGPGRTLVLTGAGAPLAFFGFALWRAWGPSVARAWAFRIVSALAHVGMIASTLVVGWPTIPVAMLICWSLLLLGNAVTVDRRLRPTVKCGRATISVKVRGRLVELGGSWDHRLDVPVGHTVWTPLGHAEASTVATALTSASFDVWAASCVSGPDGVTHGAGGNCPDCRKVFDAARAGGDA